jgi:hypothetical protein
MSVRRFVVAFARSLAAALAAMPRLVWEGGKLVAKTFFPGQPQEQAIAEEELMEEIMRSRPLPKADVGYDRPDEAWGRAAGDHLIPCGEPMVSPAAILDERAMAYLDSLDVMERAALLAYEPRHIGQHLMGERALKGLPKVPTGADWNEAEKARLAALAGPAKAGLAEIQARVDAVAAVIYEEYGSPAPRRAA